jgi:hypothetical protein
LTLCALTYPTLRPPATSSKQEDEIELDVDGAHRRIGEFLETIKAQQQQASPLVSSRERDLQREQLSARKVCGCV